MFFDKSHTNPMSWLEFSFITNELISHLFAYQEENSIRFDLITPILRSGSIPATMIANKLQIIPHSPLQLKHGKEGLRVLLSPSVPLGVDPLRPLNILVVETNTASGASAKKARELLTKVYPYAILHYASVAKVFGCEDLSDCYASCHFGVITNEAFKATSEDIEENNLRDGIPIFPWETAEFELQAINSNED